MTTEGTYPYFRGGVSTWTHNLITKLPDIEFYLVSIVPSPFFRISYHLPKNVKGLVTISLWGEEQPSEHFNPSCISILKKMIRTGTSEVEEEFIPNFKDFLEEVLLGGKNPRRMGEALKYMRNFFADHDYKKTFKSEALWKTYLSKLGEDKLYSNMTISELIDLARVLQHFLRVLIFPFPEGDVYHSSAAALCGIPAVISKVEEDVPYLLTEHGLYFRERVLDTLRLVKSFPAKIFWLNLFRAIVLTNYSYADKISPVCGFNVNWEREFGIKQEKIEVIYNGIDVDRFRPLLIQKERDVKRIVLMARVDKLKGIIDMVEAFSHVREEVKNAVCQVFGPIVDKKYYAACVRKVKELGLENSFLFMGPTNQPEIEYNRADVVALPSISEGFPYAVVEAMACGRLVVATDVGGVREALEGCGIVVPPRQPKELGKAIVEALLNDEMRDDFGKKAREKALRLYSEERFLADYLRSYVELLSEKKIEEVTK